MDVAAPANSAQASLLCVGGMVRRERDRAPVLVVGVVLGVPQAARPVAGVVLVVLAALQIELAEAPLVLGLLLFGLAAEMLGAALK